MSGNDLESQWHQIYGRTYSDSAISVLQTADGGFILANWTSSYGTGEFDMWLVKTDAQGAAPWNQIYGGIGIDHNFDVLQTAEGGFALAGYTTSYGAGWSKEEEGVFLS